MARFDPNGVEQTIEETHTHGQGRASNLATFQVNTVGSVPHVRKRPRFFKRWSMASDLGPVPAGLHVVVIPSFSTIKSKVCRSINQLWKAQSIAGWMGKNR